VTRDRDLTALARSALNDLAKGDFDSLEVFADALIEGGQIPTKGDAQRGDLLSEARSYAGSLLATGKFRMLTCRCVKGTIVNKGPHPDGSRGCEGASRPPRGHWIMLDGRLVPDVRGLNVYAEPGNLVFGAAGLIGRTTGETTIELETHGAELSVTRVWGPLEPKQIDVEVSYGVGAVRCRMLLEDNRPGRPFGWLWTFRGGAPEFTAGTPEFIA